MAHAPRPSARHLTFAMSLYPSPRKQTRYTLYSNPNPRASLLQVNEVYELLL